MSGAQANRSAEHTPTAPIADVSFPLDGSDSVPAVCWALLAIGCGLLIAAARGCIPH